MLDITCAHARQPCWFNNCRRVRTLSRAIRAAAADAEARKRAKKVKYRLDADPASGQPATTVTGAATPVVLNSLGYDFFPIGFDSAGNVGPTALRFLRAVTRTPPGRVNSNSPFIYWRNRLGFLARVASVRTYIARANLCIRAARVVSAPPPILLAPTSLPVCG